MTEPQIETPIETQLAELAATVTIGPPPMAELLTGGRRRRRRVAAVGATLAVLGVLGGGIAVLGPDRHATTTIQPAGQPDAFTPLRVKLAEGTAASGKHWEAWIASWPIVPESQTLLQQTLIWQEQRAAGNTRQAPTEAEARRQWAKGWNMTEFYLVVDGVRQRLDTVSEMPGHDTPPQPSFAQPGELLRENLGGRPDTAPKEAPDDGLGSTNIVFAVFKADTDVAVVHQPDGSTQELRPITIGDSPFRWIAYPRTMGLEGGSLEYYAADGRHLGTTLQWTS